MVGCVRGLDDIAKYRRFKLLRPLHSVHKGPKEWWLYAARCHGYRRISTERRFEIVTENLEYMDIYSKIIKNPNEVLTTKLKERKDAVEKERSYDELKLLREVTSGDQSYIFLLMETFPPHRFACYECQLLKVCPKKRIKVAVC